MARLFLIRHAEPAASWGGADADPGLSELGRAQAGHAARALLAEGALRIISSPMRRALETAAPYAALRGSTPLIEPRVGEVVAPEGVEHRSAWLQENFPWRDDTKRRSWSTLDPAAHAWREDMLSWVRGVREDTAAFSHFIAINVVAGAALARDETIVCRPGHASVTLLEVNDGALRLVRFGEGMRVDDVR